MAQASEPVNEGCTHLVVSLCSLSGLQMAKHLPVLVLNSCKLAQDRSSCAPGCQEMALCGLGDTWTATEDAAQ